MCRMRLVVIFAVLLALTHSAHQDTCSTFDPLHGLDEDFPTLSDCQTEDRTGRERRATFVTALYDIGRGEWAHYRRPYHFYLTRLMHLLSLHIDLVIFLDPSDVRLVADVRKSLGLMKRTRIIARPFSDLEMSWSRQEIMAVMSSDEFCEDNEVATAPEAFSPDYIILMNNKVAFLNEAVDINPFASSHFFWIDAGYFESADKLPRDRQWVPESLLDNKNNVTVIQLYDPEPLRDVPYINKLPVDPAFIGGFYGGYWTAIKKLYQLYTQTFDQYLHKNVVDDDQNIMVLCYFHNPSLFNRVPGSWYDAYEKFH